LGAEGLAEAEPLEVLKFGEGLHGVIGELIAGEVQLFEVGERFEVFGALVGDFVFGEVELAEIGEGRKVGDADVAEGELVHLKAAELLELEDFGEAFLAQGKHFEVEELEVGEFLEEGEAIVGVFAGAFTPVDVGDGEIGGGVETRGGGRAVGHEDVEGVEGSGVVAFFLGEGTGELGCGGGLRGALCEGEWRDD